MSDDSGLREIFKRLPVKYIFPLIFIWILLGRYSDIVEKSNEFVGYIYFAICMIVIAIVFGLWIKNFLTKD